MDESSYKYYIPFILFGILLVLSFFIIKPLLLAIIFGALLAYIFHPLYLYIADKVNSKLTASFIVCALVFLLVVIPGTLIMKTLVQESYVLYLLGKQKLAIGVFNNCDNSFCIALQNLGDNPEIRYQVQEILKVATNWVIQKGSDFVISLPRVALNLFVLLFTMFYFLKDGKIFVNHVGRFLSVREENYNYFVKRLREIIHGVVFGYLIVALIQGAIGAIGFYFFGISSPLFWGLVMAFFALFPYLGTFVIWFPASIILLLDGIFQNSGTLIFKGIGLFLYGVLVISTIDNILKPKLMGDKAKIHPAITLLGIIGGVFIFGPLGIIVGPLILSITTVFIDLYLHRL